MLSRAAPNHADLRQVQPIVCINRSDTPAGLLQPLRNLFSDKAFAAGIDAADADNNCSICRSFRALCDNPVYEFCNLVQGVSRSEEFSCHSAQGDKPKCPHPAPEPMMMKS